MADVEVKVENLQNCPEILQSAEKPWFCVESEDDFGTAYRSVVFEDLQ